jgi:tetratricopeptide (TPR) repeat protein
MDKKSALNQHSSIVHGPQTNVAGNAQGPVLSGNFQGDVIFESTEMLPDPHQLPAPPKDFVGRDKEIQQILAYFDQGETLIGLRGMGGIGKTALAIVLADKLKDRFSDAQFFIDLQGTSANPLSASQAIAQIIRAYLPTMRLPESGAELGNLYRSLLNMKRALLLLDNAAGREQVELLMPPKGCSMLITSREKFFFGGLKTVDLEELPSEDACRLLLADTGRIGDYAAELAKLCGYLPLALRNAASILAERINLEVPEYLRRLKDAKTRLDLVEASFSLSYDLLSPQLQELWCKLSVFPADFDCKAAEAVWELDSNHAENALGELVKLSLANYAASPGGRYRLHDLARLYAKSKLNPADGLAARQRHAEYYQSVYEKATRLYMNGGSSATIGLALFDAEQSNIQAGQAWAEKNVEINDRAAALCSNYGKQPFLLLLRLHPREQISWFVSALDAARRLKDRRMEGMHLGNLGLANYSLSDFSKAIEYYEQSLAIAREIGDRMDEDNALSNLGLAYHNLGKYRKAIEFHEQSLAVACEIGDRKGEGIALGNLGRAYYSLGDYFEAIKYHEQSLVIAREIGDKKGEGIALGNLGLAYRNRHDYRKAIEYHERSLIIAHEIGDRLSESAALGNLGLNYNICHNYRKAIEYSERRLTIAREIGDRRGEGIALGDLGLAYYSRGDYRKAAEYHEQSLFIAREICYKKGEGKNLFALSLVLDKLKQREKAVRLARDALKIYEQIESPHAEQVRQKLADWLRH